MDKTEKILDMIAHPERYTEQDFENMLQDEEAMKLYRTMTDTQEAFIHEENEKADVDAEWEKFSKKLDAKLQDADRTLQVNSDEKAEKPMKSAHFFSLHRVAAMIGGVVLISGLSFAAIQMVKHNQESKPEQTETVKSDKIDQKQVSDTTEVKAEAPEKEHIQKTFENVTLETMLHEMGDYYAIQVHIKNAKTAKLRLYYDWDSKSDINQVVKELNQFENVNIVLDENTLTLE